MRQCLDGPVMAIAHPPSDAELERGLHRGVAISDTLHAPANREALRLDSHNAPALAARKTEAAALPPGGAPVADWDGPPALTAGGVAAMRIALRLSCCP